MKGSENEYRMVGERRMSKLEREERAMIMRVLRMS